MDLVVIAGGLVDVDREIVRRDQYIAIDGGAIAAIGARARLPRLAPAAAVIDFSAGYVLPGLVNCHAHAAMSFPPGEHRLETLAVLSNGHLKRAAAGNLRCELASGVTMFRDCGSPGRSMFEVRQAVEGGRLASPRLLVSGPPITTARGHLHFWGLKAAGVEAVREAVGSLAKIGADFIKVMATGGGTAGTAPAAPAYSVPELRAIVDKARRRHLRVAAHCRGIAGLRGVIAAGVDMIEHACFERPDGSLKFEPRIADQLATRGIWVIPTIQLYRDLIADLRERQSERALTPAERLALDRWRRARDEKYRILEGLLRAGVRCVVGNDAGLPLTRFGRLWQELEAMTMGGMKPMEAVMAATKWAAEALGVADEAGSLQVGKRADLIGVKGDPTAEVKALAEVELVVQDGRAVVWKSDDQVQPMES